MEERRGNSIVFVWYFNNWIVQKFMDNKINMSQLMSMLSKMDKKDLENGLNQVSQILKSKDANTIIDEIKKEKM